MTKVFRAGAAGALLDEYERAIGELQATIRELSDTELQTIADSATADPDCRSIQTILAHVVRSGFCYAIEIQALTRPRIDFPHRIPRSAAWEYCRDLDQVFAFTETVFATIRDSDLEQPDSNKKILTSWGQTYDIEQIMEHAIVHILRHRRQVEKFKISLLQLQ